MPCQIFQSFQRIYGSSLLNSYNSRIECYENNNYQRIGCLAKKDLAKLRRGLKEQKIGLLNGCDDPHDECLGFEFTDGYVSHVPTCDHRPAGSLESYLIKAGIAERVFGIEVPGRISLAKKRRVVATVFGHLISCFFG